MLTGSGVRRRRDGSKRHGDGIDVGVSCCLLEEGKRAVAVAVLAVTGDAEGVVAVVDVVAVAS